MECAEFQQCAGAFADGELEGSKSLEARDHAETCPACSAHVAEIAVLKTGLARVFGGVRAPQRLRRQIEAALDAELATPKSAVAPATRRRLRLFAPMGVAAALVAAALLWWTSPWTSPTSRELVEVSGKVVNDIRQQHRQCVLQRGMNHHGEPLPHNLPGIVEHLSAELQLAVIAPDYSAEGFDLAGADRCGIMGLRGAHVLYYSRSTNVALSVFTVGRTTALGEPPGDRNRDDVYFVSWDDPLAVVAWHSGPQTHAICAALPGSRLIDLADGGWIAQTELPPMRLLGSPAYALAR